MTIILARTAPHLLPLRIDGPEVGIFSKTNRNTTTIINLSLVKTRSNPNPWNSFTTSKNNNRLKKKKWKISRVRNPCWIQRRSP